jgi:long-chain acyl-CoA synthetase
VFSYNFRYKETRDKSYKMALTRGQVVRRWMMKYLVITPFLFVIGIFDFIIGCILPYKYDDSKLPDKNTVLSRQVDLTDNSSAFRSTLFSDLIRTEVKATNLYSKLAENIENQHDAKTIGVREIISIDDEVQKNGKVFKKYDMGDYKWMTYAQVFDRINNFSNGLLSIGLKSNQNVVLFAETRPEWIMSAFGCFRIKVPIVTLYATLGVDALAYGINQTSAQHVFTSTEQLPKLAKILQKIPNITTVVVFDDKFTQKNLLDFKLKCPGTVKLFTMSEVETMGKETPTIEKYEKPTKDDLAIIMYTSGSTGKFKLNYCISV